jgi:tetratricopeptide (TPR) repeat protein
MKRAVVVLFAMVCSRDASADAKADAQVHIDRAKTLHGEGKLADALAALKEAYVLDPRPELLFAIGQIHVGLGQCPDAITFYERYLSTRPSAESASVTNEAIKACKEKPDAFVKPEPKPEPEPPPAPLPPPMETKVWYRDVLGDALVGAGVVSGVVGIVFYTSARSDRSKADDVTSFQQYSDLIDDAKGNRTKAIIFGVVGAGLVAGGVVRLVMQKRKTDGIALVPASGGGLVTWTGGF